VPRLGCVLSPNGCNFRNKGSATMTAIVCAYNHCDCTADRLGCVCQWCMACGLEFVLSGRLVGCRIAYLGRHNGQESIKGPATLPQ